MPIFISMSMSKSKAIILAALGLFSTPTLATDHLQPVDGRTQGWNSVWDHLASHIPSSPGVVLTAILVQPPTGQSWMVYVKGSQHEQCTVHTAQLDTSWLEVPLEKVPVTVHSQKLDSRMAEVLHQRVTQTLLQTRYSNTPVELGSMDVDAITVAAYHQETLTFLMGTELMPNIPKLSWLMDTAVQLRQFTQGKSSAAELDKFITAHLAAPKPRPE